jgi:hypothetical protein
MSTQTSPITRQAEAALDNLHRAETMVDPTTPEGFHEWTVLILEFKLAWSIDNERRKSEHDLMSGAINAVK